MAIVQPFQGVRYDLARAGALGDLIAPPYDVIDETLSQQLHAKSRYNAIRLELNPEQPSDTQVDNRYRRAAALLADWRKEGILRRDPEPAFYVYYQTFDWEGESYTRRGFMGRLRLEPFGQNVFPHEETLSGPKADRLALYHATGMNLSQVFGLYPDETNEVAGILDRAVAACEPLSAVDHLGVRHQLWVMTDAELLRDLSQRLRPRPVFIADGHHRYETGLRYREDRERAGELQGPDDPANFILMMLVSMSDAGLRVMPTHRLARGLGPFDSRTMAERLAEHFHVEVIGKGPSAGEQTWTRILASGRQDALGLGSTADETWLLATLKSPASMDRLVPDHSPAWRSLGVAILHRLVFDHCLLSHGQPTFRYVHLTSEVLESMSARDCDVAALVQPATVEHIRSLAGTLEKMPPKSTYFYPKLACGLVFNEIRSEA